MRAKDTGRESKRERDTIPPPLILSPWGARSPANVEIHPMMDPYDVMDDYCFVHRFVTPPDSDL